MCWAEYKTELSKTFTVVLIHPSDPSLNREVSILVPASALDRDVLEWGNANWMTARDFEAFAKDSKFAFGVK